MFGLGPWELVIILVLVVFFYGGRRLPLIGEGLGRGIQQFKQAVKGPSNEGSTGKDITKD
jgi:sec-independent protein translocase protein TatA